MKDIQRGGRSCTNSSDCGGEDQGYCDQVLGCLCLPGWTGPSCLASYTNDTINMYLEMYPPKSAHVGTFGIVLLSILVVAVATVGVIAGRAFYKRKGYSSIPNSSEDDPTNGITLNI